MSARMSFVAARMQPNRVIVEIDLTPSIALLSLECGHVAQYARHFSYSLGNNVRCLECGRAAARLLPEFCAEIEEKFND